MRYRWGTQKKKKKVNPRDIDGERSRRKIGR